MIVCGKCKKEMTCLKVGTSLVFGGNWVYPADTFHCTDCGCEIVSSGNSQAYSSDQAKDLPTSIIMPEGS